MPLTLQDQATVERIAKRLASDDDATFRAGGRAVALQAIEHRHELVRMLRTELARHSEQPMSDRRRGYVDALEDVLLAAEAALEPRRLEAQARRELAREPRLMTLVQRAAVAPLTPGQAARATGMSISTGTRDLDRLCAVGLLTELPAADGRERLHRASPLAARLIAETATPVEIEEVEPAADEFEQLVAAHTGG